MFNILGFSSQNLPSFSTVYSWSPRRKWSLVIKSMRPTRSVVDTPWVRLISLQSTKFKWISRFYWSTQITDNVLHPSSVYNHHRNLQSLKCRLQTGTEILRFLDQTIGILKTHLHEHKSRNYVDPIRQVSTYRAHRSIFRPPILLPSPICTCCINENDESRYSLVRILKSEPGDWSLT